ncbi:hypothetical protein GFS31_17570 [Leptolyngbya sp. BL0902]|uniref:hypothetical protein n=1 Tax=Leptolyngbya sp. BL0902 TaxID=1115757 RepID=UPI0018E90653|nr:hypothetical protein [Leptolyngbya sp. BL0902]QQE65072.1 hypothetical protein GFS31_17570 [Leptolyngbya sp. BL0902]
MPIDLSQLPEGLDANLSEALVRCAQRADAIDLAYLGNRVQAHLQRARFAAQGSSLVNLAQAEALATTYDRLLGQWATLPAVSQPWLKGAMLYFVETDDDDPDFESPAGLEDDVVVLNACLHLAGLAAWCVDPQQR